MNKSIATIVLVLIFTGPAFAADTVYHIFAHGMACRYCAFGVDKQLREIEGVKQVDIYLDKGLINVRVKEGTRLTEGQIKTLLENAGVTYQRMEHHPLK